MKKKLKEIEKDGGVVGVDGSNNMVGGAKPHYIELYQGLAKSTKYQDRPIFRTDYFTPMNMESRGVLEKGEESDDAIRKKKLAEIELDVAIEAIDKLSPSVVLMDGTLMRYAILAEKKWTILKEKSLEEGVILVGVIEDIKTSIIWESLNSKEDEENKDVSYDREILYGHIDYGEMVEIFDDRTKKSKEGLSSAFLRSSDSPSVIGVDVLKDQKASLEMVVGLILSLTPRDSRGIPFWLDLVDVEARISNKTIEALLEEHMDRRIYEMLFIPERNKRTL